MLFAFGNCGEGQLGIGSVDEEQVLLPRKVGSFNPQEESDISKDHHLTPDNERFDGNSDVGTIKHIACGARHTLFLQEDGSILSCGNNDNGQLGHEGLRTRPTLIAARLQELMVKQVAAGASHSAVLTNDGRIFTWGGNMYGQLGTAPVVKLQEYNPDPMYIDLPGIKFSLVACGGYHTLALSTEGNLYSWGLNSHGQLGLGHTTNESRPQKIRSLTGVALRQISASSDHSMVLSVSGAVFSFGKNSHGQLGAGDTADRCHPYHVKQLRYQKIVYLSCGDLHSAALTYDGRLFTFGSGSYGQLGHGTKKNEEYPKQVTEMMGSKVTRVACGRFHTVAMVGQRVYTFGLGGSGQLGLGNPDLRVIPVRLKELEKPNWRMTGIYAGGDQTFVRAQLALVSREPSPDPRNLCLLMPESMPYLTLERIKTLISGPVDVLQNELSNVLSSAACINCSFLTGGMEHFGASKNNPGVRMDDVRDSSMLLEDNPHSSRISEIMLESLQLALIPELPAQPPDIETLRLYLILPWLHVFLDCQQFRELQAPFASHLASLGAIPKTVIEKWWCDFEIRHFNRVLKVFKNVVIYVLNIDDKPGKQITKEETDIREKTFRSCLEILAMLKRVNQESHKVPFDLFYISEISEKVDIRQEYAKFILRKDSSKFTFCDYPFIFDAAIKTLLLQTDALIQMQLMVDEANRTNVQALFVPIQPVSPYLVLQVSRENIVNDTLAQLLSMQQLDLKKPMKVQFAGEEADDAGGVKKEFFMLLFQELLHPQYGMFREYEETRKLWFLSHSFEDVGMYQMVGMLFGLAIYNAVLVNMPFPLVLYKKLLKQPTTYEDLKELTPTEARSLEQMLEYEGDDFDDVFCLAFDISTSCYGVTNVVELKENGSNITVTKENRQEYVNLYANYILDTSIRGQFDAFADGFLRVVTSRILNFFQPQELMEMSVGNEQYDWDVFEQNTDYRGEYWRRHETIMLFWDVFHELNMEQKKKFLLFLTGCDRVPLRGMKQIKMTIQPSGGEDDYCPVAHTCFNLLDLPKYRTRAKLKDRLLHSIEHTQGFTLV